MLLTLDVPYADSRAADLALLLDGPDEASLATLTVPLAGGTTLELRLLGHSHQAVVTDPGGARFTETVACGRGGRPGLPERTSDGRYGFTAQVERLDPAAFERRVADLLAGARAAAPGTALAGRFPGAPTALTLLRAEPAEDGAARWRTWHAYPDHGEIVATESVLWPA